MIPLKTYGMGDQVTNNSAALRLFFTEDVYLLKEDVQPMDKQEETQVPHAQHTETVSILPTVNTQAAATSTAIAELNFKYLGKNLRDILILVHDRNNDVSTDEGRELLRNIVKAIGLTANDFALINYAEHPGVTFDQFRKSLSSKTLFAFGVTPDQLGLPVTAQHTATQYNSVTMIFSSDLHQLSTDQQGKKMLWGSLKQMNL
ncbi:MAG: hypothetical protein EOO88_11415 [Pedobacter sp.]|nr:MAG: hypothetical protein EOO88_11415 [Pedobacter sp.]